VIEILEENGLTYAVDPSCDGTTAAVRDFRTCSVPITSLMAPPFTLPWGAQVVARVTAWNSYGPSLVSPPTASGQRAIILRSPDAPLSLANDLQVTVYSNAALSGTTLSATHIRVDRNQDSGNTAATTQLSGVVSSYDSSAKTLVVGSTPVSLGSVTVTDLKGNASTLSNGAYVLVRGTLGSDGSITASSVKVRTADTTAALAQVMLIGPITDFVDASSFVVRGVPVDAGSLWSTACPGVTAAADVLVRVQALQQAGTPVVKAQSLSCPPPASLPTQVIRSQEGTASAVDLTAKTFTLTLADTGASPNTRTVQWNEATTFNGLTGYLSGTVLNVDGGQNFATPAK